MPPAVISVSSASWSVLSQVTNFSACARCFDLLEIAVADPASHHHVPLLVSPYSCASYRGG